MDANTFCDMYIDDMLHNHKTFNSNYNINYHNDIFHSYAMPICKHIKAGDERHIFQVLDRDKSPSKTTSKHMSKLVWRITKAMDKNPAISLETVQEIKRDNEEEQDDR